LAVSRRARRDRRRAGAVLAEFALVVVVVWLLLAALVEFGRILAVGQTQLS
jgi:Flp pilus assembly protein TadG